ncbi:MAG: PAS domain-containing protein [Nitrospiraceae bacterium]|nr:PAS domain-containing protein [Nitrospiraceae bacterium]
MNPIKGESETLRRLLTESSPRIEGTVVLLLDVIGDGLRIVDKDFRVVYENQAHRDLLGNHVGEHCYRAYQHRDTVCDDCAVYRSFLDGKIHKDVRSVMTDKGTRYVEVTSSNLRDAAGNVIAGVEIVRDVTDRQLLEVEREKLIAGLREAFDKIKTLKGLIPVCAWCRKARNDKGYWDDLENYVREHTDADFTHGICPECLRNAVVELESTEDEKSG